ncbi:MAG: hypothetical protein ACXVJ7_02635 [Acidimicrobiia bacterium]
MANLMTTLGNGLGLDFLAPNGRLIEALLITIVMIALAVVMLRRPKPDRPTTWAEAIGGAVYVFALFLMMYAVVPHEFITVADKYWGLSTSRYIIKSTTAIPFMKSWNWPFSIDLQHGVRDILVVLIYVAFFAGNIAMFVLWQKRPTVSEAAEAEPVPAGRSWFGRPLKAKA